MTSGNSPPQALKSPAVSATHATDASSLWKSGKLGREKAFPAPKTQLAIGLKTTAPNGAERGARDDLTRFDRYLLSQLLQLFGFFSLILVLIYWINRAVGLFDRLIGDGQSALVFLEISLLTLPNVVRIVLPVAAFAATVFVTNRMAQDGELVVVQATGFSGFRLARPVFYFGMIVALMMYLLMNFIVPASRITLADRTAEIGSDLTAQLLVDGQFVHPVDGVTFYIREISDRGELLDFFLADDRNPTQRVTYSARRALLLRDDNSPKLIMLDGMRQSLDLRSNRLTMTHFQDATQDLGSVLVGDARGARSVDELSTAELLSATPALQEEVRAREATLRSEGNQRLAQPLLAPAAALIGFAVMLLGSFSRFGLWRQIGGAVIGLICVQMINNAATSASLSSPQAWPLVYLAPIAGIAAAFGLLAFGQRSKRRPNAALSTGDASS